MSNLQIFNNPEFGQVRIIVVNGKEYAVGNDIAKALEYAEPHKAIASHCKGGITYPILTNGGTQETKIIPEGDIYRLIVKAADQSKNPVIKEKAERFERWIFDEVLPSIRKHGGYLTPAKVEEALLNPDIIIRLATDLKVEREKRQRLEIENAQQFQIIHELQPKATYYDLILQTKAAISVSQIAKDYGLTATKLNGLLHDFKVQYKQGDTWLLYRDHAPMGYTTSKTHNYTNRKNEQCSKLHTYWTQKGRLFIYDLLKQHRILPMIEREGLRLVSNE